VRRQGVSLLEGKENVGRMGGVERGGGGDETIQEREKRTRKLGKEKKERKHRPAIYHPIYLLICPYPPHTTLLTLLFLTLLLLLLLSLDLLNLLLKLPHPRPCPGQHHRDPPHQALMTCLPHHLLPRLHCLQRRVLHRPSERDDQWRKGNVQEGNKRPIGLARGSVRK
jgi:hypothetical protein